MADYKIKLETEADLSGAEVTEDALDAVAEATKKAAEESKRAGDDEAKAARRLAFELNLVEQRAKAVAAAFQNIPSDPFGGQLSSGNSADDVTEIKSVTNALGEQEEVQRRLAENEKNANEDLRKAIGLRKEKTEALEKGTEETRKLSGQVAAMALAQGASAVGQFAQSFRALAQDLADVDPQLAKTIDGIGAVGQTLADVGGAAAQGFAVGGPWGAVATATLSLFGKGLTAITKDAADTQKAMEDATRQAEAMTEKMGDIAQKTAELKLDSQYQQSWKNLQATVDVVNQSVRDHLALQAQVASAENQIAESRRAAQEEIIRAQADSGAITAQAAEAQLAALRAQAAESTKAASLADAQRRQASIEADLEAAKLQADAAEARRDKAQNDLADAQKKWDDIANNPAISNAQKRATEGAIVGAEKELKEAEVAVTQSRDRIVGASNAVQAGKESLAVEIAKIEAVASNNETKAKVAELSGKLDEAGKESARKISEAIAGVDTQLQSSTTAMERLHDPDKFQRQTEALDTLKRALADGEITASESKNVAKALADLNDKVNGNLKELVDIAMTSSKVQDSMNAQIQQMKANMGELQRTVSQQLSSQ